MKNFLFLLSLLVVMSCGSAKQTTTAAAETAPPPPAAPRGPGMQQAQARYDSLLLALDLTPEQTTQMRAINEKYRQEMQTLRQSNQGDFQAMRDAMQALRGRQEEEIKGVLTLEQYEQYQTAMQAMRQQGGRRMGPGRNGG